MTGTSARENLADVREFVDRQIGSEAFFVLDVGAGGGTYADALAGLPVVLMANEAWAPTVATLRRDRRYAQVFDSDIRDWQDGSYDEFEVVIFGDVLEHMSIHDAHATWDRAYRSGAWVLVSVPNKPYPQGAIDGNHLEEHLILDPVTELIAHLPEPQERWDYPVTSTFVWKKEA